MNLSEDGLIVIFLRLQKILGWLGLVPFPNQKGDWPKIKSLHPLLVVSLYTGFMIYSWYDNMKTVLLSAERIDCVTIVLNNCSRMLFILSSCTGAVYYESNWKAVLTKLHNFENKFKISERQNNVFINSCFGSFTMLCLMEIIFVFMSTIKFCPFLCFKETVTHFFHYYQLATVLLICYFTSAYSKKYKELAVLLEKRQYTGKISKFRTEQSREELSRILNLYREQCSIVMEFYFILRWQVFFIILNYFFGILNLTIFFIIVLPESGINDNVLLKIGLVITDTVSNIRSLFLYSY